MKVVYVGNKTNNKNIPYFNVKGNIPLTIGKVYEVLKTEPYSLSGKEHILIENDINKRRYYSSSIFITLDEHRELQLYSILT